MASALLRLLALVALLVMPLGMAGAPVAAQPVAVAANDHCADHQQPADAHHETLAHCTACAALPAIEPAAAVAPLFSEPLPHVVPASRSGEPDADIATPPPKRF